MKIRKLAYAVFRSIDAFLLTLPDILNKFLRQIKLFEYKSGENFILLDSLILILQHM